jgi:hypothetical protein
MGSDLALVPLVRCAVFFICYVKPNPLSQTLSTTAAAKKKSALRAPD